MTASAKLPMMVMKHWPSEGLVPGEVAGFDIGRIGNLKAQGYVRDLTEEERLDLEGAKAGAPASEPAKPAKGKG